MLTKIKTISLGFVNFFLVSYYSLSLILVCVISSKCCLLADPSQPVIYDLVNIYLWQVTCLLYSCNSMLNCIISSYSFSFCATSHQPNRVVFLVSFTVLKYLFYIFVYFCGSLFDFPAMISLNFSYMLNVWNIWACLFFPRKSHLTLLFGLNSSLKIHINTHGMYSK